MNHPFNLKSFLKDLELQWGNKNFRHLVLLPTPPFQLVSFLMSLSLIVGLRLLQQKSQGSNKGQGTRRRRAALVSSWLFCLTQTE